MSLEIPVQVTCDGCLQFSIDACGDGRNIGVPAFQLLELRLNAAIPLPDLTKQLQAWLSVQRGEPEGQLLQEDSAKQDAEDVCERMQMRQVSTVFEEGPDAGEYTVGDDSGGILEDDQEDDAWCPEAPEEDVVRERTQESDTIAINHFGLDSEREGVADGVCRPGTAEVQEHWTSCSKPDPTPRSRSSSKPDPTRCGSKQSVHFEDLEKTPEHEPSRAQSRGIEHSANSALLCSGRAGRPASAFAIRGGRPMSASVKLRPASASGGAASNAGTQQSMPWQSTPAGEQRSGDALPFGHCTSENLRLPLRPSSPPHVDRAVVPKDASTYTSHVSIRDHLYDYDSRPTNRPTSRPTSAQPTKDDSASRPTSRPTSASRSDAFRAARTNACVSAGEGRSGEEWLDGPEEWQSACSSGRRPSLVAPPSTTTVCVRNLRKEATQEELLAIFEAFGIITNASISSLGSSALKQGFVSFATRNEAEEAHLALLNGAVSIGGSKVRDFGWSKSNASVPSRPWSGRIAAEVKAQQSRPPSAFY